MMKIIKLTDKKGLTNTFEFDEMPQITVDGEVVVFKIKKYIPKAGDCVEMKININTIFAQIKTIEDNIVKYNHIIYNNRFEDIGMGCELVINDSIIFTKITPDQLQAKYNELGFQYNFENDTVEKMKWAPKNGDKIWWFGMELKSQDSEYNGRLQQQNRCTVGNCFKTESECLAKIEQIKDILK